MDKNHYLKQVEGHYPEAPGIIPVTRPSMPSRLRFVQESSVLWMTRNLTNGGPENDKLTRGLKDRLEVEDDRLILTANGHIALLLALYDIQNLQNRNGCRPAAGRRSNLKIQLWYLELVHSAGVSCR